MKPIGSELPGQSADNQFALFLVVVRSCDEMGLSFVSEDKAVRTGLGIDATHHPSGQLVIAVGGEAEVASVVDRSFHQFPAPRAGMFFNAITWEEPLQEIWELWFKALGVERVFHSQAVDVQQEHAEFYPPAIFETGDDHLAHARGE